MAEIRAAADRVDWSAAMNRDEMRERIKSFVPSDVRVWALDTADRRRVDSSAGR